MASMAAVLLLIVTALVCTPGNAALMLHLYSGRYNFNRQLLFIFQGHVGGGGGGGDKDLPDNSRLDHADRTTVWWQKGLL